MEKIAVMLFVVIAIVAFVGLIRLDTSTGQAYYTSYQYRTQALAGRLDNAPFGDSVWASANGQTFGKGTITGGVYQMTLSGSWREQMALDIFVDDKYCTSMPVTRVLIPPQILYSGHIAVDLVCT